MDKVNTQFRQTIMIGLIVLIVLAVIFIIIGIVQAVIPQVFTISSAQTIVPTSPAGQPAGAPVVAPVVAPVAAPVVAPAVAPAVAPVSAPVPASGSEDVIKTTELPKEDAMVILHAKWCGYCRQNYPEFEKAARKSKLVRWYAIDIDGARAVADQLQCNAVPSVYMLKNGQVTKYNKKLKETDLLDAVKEHYGKKVKDDMEGYDTPDGQW